ncbi:MAG: OmpA family protein [Flavobacteriales bacterium]|nr:OmpA family protein [Flavobacteriales bacterium]
MKHLICLFLAFFGWSVLTDAQVDQLFERAKRKAEQRANRKIDQGIDKGLDKVVEDSAKGRKKNKKKEKEEKEPEEGAEERTNMDGASASGDGSAKADASIAVWTERYDFQPGAEIIFYDDLEGESSGEITSKWAYTKGVLEVAEITGTGKGMIGDLHTHPNWEKGFLLPEEYTIEFDAWMDPERSRNQYTYRVDFMSGTYDKKVIALTVRPGELDMGNLFNGKVPGSTKESAVGKWAHISISVNGNSVKGYYDQYRLFNVRIPGDARPDLFLLSACCPHDDHPYAFLVDNVKVAAGAHAKYKEEVLKGRIVTHNILFEVDRADLLPRSYAEIKRIADLMSEDPSLDFTVEGHTDSDGSDEHNAELSLARAKAVVKAMTDMGIEAKRLKTSGKGEQEPMAPNDSPEGKAKNRRVVFVKT